MRRVFRWQAALLTTAALIVGCDSSNSTTPAKDADAKAAPADSAEAAKAPVKQRGAKRQATTTRQAEQ